MRIVDPSFNETVDRWSYRVGVSQILTRNMILSLGLEVITDEGYLHNPYRSFRYYDPEDDRISSSRPRSIRTRIPAMRPH